MVYSSPSSADVNVSVRSRSSILLDNRLKELQETLRKKTSNFHVRVSVPGELCRVCRHHKCHSCLPVQHHQHQEDYRDLSSLGDYKASHDNRETRSSYLPILKYPSVEAPKVGLSAYQKISLLHCQLKSLPPNQWSNLNSLSGNVLHNNDSSTTKLDGQEKWKPADGARKSGTEYEFNAKATLSFKLSVLKDEIKSFWQGHQSPRQRLEILRQRHDFTQAKIQSLEEGQHYLKEKILALEQKSKERNRSLEKMRLNRIKALEDTKDSCSNSAEQRVVKSTGVACDTVVRAECSTMVFGSDAKELVNITEFWTENNCEFHVNRIISSLRQLAAYEILEFCHNRLSSHLMDHISESFQELQLEEKRTSYVRMFRILEDTEQYHPTSFPFVLTYAEVLEFVQQHMQEGKRVKKELWTALKDAEKKLLEDAESEGYSKNLVGDIRWQMTGFKMLEEKFGNTKYCTESMAKLEKLEETKDIVDDIIRTIEEGDLGVLERASKLIKLGCYFLERQRLLNPPTAAEELDSLVEIDADSQSE